MTDIWASLVPRGTGNGLGELLAGLSQRALWSLFSSHMDHIHPPKGDVLEPRLDSNLQGHERGQVVVICHTAVKFPVKIGEHTQFCISGLPPLRFLHLMCKGRLVWVRHLPATTRAFARPLWLKAFFSFTISPVSSRKFPFPIF